MARPRATFPTIHERRRGRAVHLRIWWNDRWHSVGRKGDDKGEVRRRVMAIVGNAPMPPRARLVPSSDALSVHGLFAAFLDSASRPGSQGHYSTFQRAGILLGDFCGGSFPAASVTSQRLEEWRDWLCGVKCVYNRSGVVKAVLAEKKETLSEQYIAKLIAATRAVYKWATRKGLVPNELGALDRLPAGRARRSPPKSSARPADVEKILPHLPKCVADMIELQRATAMRPSEVWRLKPCEVHRAGVVAVDVFLIDLDDPAAGGCWLYVPGFHKTQGTGGLRVVPIPPAIQPVLSPYLDRNPQAYCFSPRETGVRKMGPWPRAPRDHWDTGSYGRAIRRACDKAGVKFTANQLRHLRLTEAASKHGGRLAQLLAGHASLTTTSRYLSLDWKALFRSVGS